MENKDTFGIENDGISQDSSQQIPVLGSIIIPPNPVTSTGITYNSTHLIVEERRELVLQMLLSGKSHKQIQHTIQHQYGISKKSVENDITQSYLVIRDNYTTDPSSVIAKHIGMYYRNWEEARANKQFGAANQALHYLEKLVGLHKVEQTVNIQQNNLNLDKLTPEELLKIASTGIVPDNHDTIVDI